MVTGASDGIGKEFAIQLAKQGFNIVLISRTNSKLATVASEIKARHSSVQTKCVAIDFAQPLCQRSDDNQDSERGTYVELELALAGLEIAVLINNVGRSHSIPVPFVNTPAQEMQDIININCGATLQVTQMIATKMVARRRGLIITIASFGGIVPTPLLATYSGSKAFLQHWSSALAAELAPAGIKVHLVQSHLVTSAMSKIRKPSALVPTPKVFVTAALAKIGRSGGAQGIAATGTPYWAHALMHWALASITGTMNWVVVNRNKAMHEQIRSRALRKLEREEKKA